MSCTPPRLPSIELNMSLLSSPLATTSIDDKKPFQRGRARGDDDDNEPSTQSHAVEATNSEDNHDPLMSMIPLSHEQLLKDASKWVMQLEALRDEMHMLSVRNAILLDSLAMAGADV